MDERYQRQILIQQIGDEGQEKLNKASILVVGAGGLGSPILTYLVAAGVGRLGVVDCDTIALSNLNRQFLHNTSDIGRKKTESAKEKLLNLNDKIEIITCNERLTGQNAENIFSGKLASGDNIRSYDIVIGAVDSFETRFVINKACAVLNIPYIDGGINGFSGCLIFSKPPDTPCLNCIFPEKAAKKEITGVLGTTAGVIGTMQANIAILRLLGLPNPIENKLLMYDGLRMSFDYIEIKRNDECSICSSKGAEKVIK
jgi:adenylyltransferase/sulfurtransferase